MKRRSSERVVDFRSPLPQQDIDQLCINTIRTLAMDAVQHAHSGHPGTPMALAPIVYCLWQRFLRFDPAHPIWPNRDRFVLSAGHASMLLYAILHLTGVKSVNSKYEVLGEPAVSLEDIKRFRQLDSKCPGHPEYRWTAGVETTTGPLGQGVATSVGMAIAARWGSGYFNRPGFDIFDYDIYALCGDGCMMEGISGEAASMAGHLKLANLCWIYDNNHITIEGNTALTYSDDVAARFIGYGWNVTRVGDANDLELLDRAFTTFKNTNDRPTLIIVDSHIAYGAPTKQDTSAAHGEPLGEEEIRLTKRRYQWPEESQFLVPDSVREHFREGIGARGQALHKSWWAKFEEYRNRYPELAEDGHRMLRRELPDGWDRGMPTFPANAKGIATRDASGQVLNALAKNVPWLAGGSADLAPSCKTRLAFDEAGDFTAENPAGRNLHFGIREHAMGAMLNGLSLSKIRPFGSGFLIFSDYERTSIRLSALMEIPVIHIFTHDSIGVGEDGPTHQPVEQLASLRAIPGLITLRPADANEVVEAWRLLMPFRHEPVALILSRQALPTLDRTKYASAAGVRHGAYILADTHAGKPDVLLLATGSEVALCIDAYEQLKGEGIKARVVSMPSWEIFESYCRKHPEYREEVLPESVTARVSVEQASTLGWSRYVGMSGRMIGMETFGASAPLKELQRKFGFTPDSVVVAARQQVELTRSRAGKLQPVKVQEPRLTITQDRYGAILFDMDGVVTDTASIHAACWKTMFDEFLQKWADQNARPFRPFDIAADYARYVDGKPRYQGVRDFVESRGIVLPKGTPQDPSSAQTICGLGNRKNELVNDRLRSGGVQPYPGTVAFIMYLRRLGFKTAIVTSSQNCEEVLRAAKVEDLFDAQVDGNVIAEQHLAGKPAPDSFLKAAEMLHVSPERAVVVEDAISGVKAGHEGRFGLVIGVNRKNNAEELKANGADVVVNYVAELLAGLFVQPLEPAA
jgi:transketolase